MGTGVRHEQKSRIHVLHPGDPHIFMIWCSDTVQWAGWKATPPLPDRTGINACPLKIQQQLAAKCKLLRNWQHFRTPENKRLLNAAITQVLQKLATRASCIFASFAAEELMMSIPILLSSIKTTTFQE
jgi:hypothetical protein